MPAVLTALAIMGATNYSWVSQSGENSLRLIRIEMVPAARLELARPCERQILSLLCLPFHQAGFPYS